MTTRRIEITWTDSNEGGLLRGVAYLDGDHLGHVEWWCDDIDALPVAREGIISMIKRQAGWGDDDEIEIVA